MAKAHNQQRWRQNTAKQRIEAHLDADLVARLTAWAEQQELTRPAALEALIRAGTPERPAAVESKPVTATDTMASEPPAAEVPSNESTVATALPSYRFRRPQAEDEQRYQWIAVTNDEDRIGLRPDPSRFYRWVGRFIHSSMFSRDCEGNSRDAVVQRMLKWPEIYR